MHDSHNGVMKTPNSRKQQFNIFVGPHFLPATLASETSLKVRHLLPLLFIF